MSLIKCKECGKEISSKAKSCPSCGNPIKQKSSVFGIFLMFLLLLLILFITIPFIMSPSSPAYKKEKLDVVEFGRDCMRSIGLDPYNSSATISYEETIAIGDCLDKKLGR